MATSILPEIETSVRFVRQTRDYDCHLVVDGVEQYIGSRGTYAEAEALCREERAKLLESSAIPAEYDMEACPIEQAQEVAAAARTATVVIQSNGLQYAIVTVAADSTAELTVQEMYDIPYAGLTVDGRFHPLVQIKFLSGRPELETALQAALEQVQAAIAGLTLPPAAEPTTTAAALPPVYILAAVAAELAETARQADDFAAERAFNKAALHIHQGVAITRTIGGVLVPSGTRSSVVHRVCHRTGCTCEAARNGRMCWHAALVEAVTLAQARALPAAKPRVRISRAQVQAGVAARLARRIITARAQHMHALSA